VTPGPTPDALPSSRSAIKHCWFSLNIAACAGGLFAAGQRQFERTSMLNAMRGDRSSLPVNILRKCGKETSPRKKQTSLAQLTCPKGGRAGRSGPLEERPNLRASWGPATASLEAGTTLGLGRPDRVIYAAALAGFSCEGATGNGWALNSGRATASTSSM
jgi:hypothetical protein